MHVRQYPDPYCRALTAAIAAHEAVPEDFILCGAGAAELIYAYCDALRPKKAMELAPTFLEYSAAASHFGARDGARAAASAGVSAGLTAF